MIFFYLQAGFFYFHWWVDCIKPQWVFNESCSCVFNVRSFDWYIGGLNAYMPCQTWSIPCSDLTLFLDIKLTLFLNFLKNSHLNVCIQWIRIYPFRQYKNWVFISGWNSTPPHININSHSETNHSESAPLALVLCIGRDEDIQECQIYSNELNPIC